MEQLLQTEACYNFKELCCAVLHKDLAAANAVLVRQSHVLFDGNGAPVTAMRVFLTSLNRSLYNYLLYALDLSLYQCCFENLSLTHRCHTRSQFFSLARQILYSYMDCIQRPAPEGSCHVLRAKEYIEAHLDEPLRLGQVARQVHLSPSHLSELFVKCSGLSFSAYVRERRLERAGQLLLTTRKSIQDISLECGFTTAAYFSTVFTKWAGMTPRQYRLGSPPRQSA